MISSVIARLNCDPEAVKVAASRIAAHPAIEVGTIVDGRMLPATIESSGNREAEEVTRWISSVDGVAFVDVVYVHLEEDDIDNSAKTEN